jgi:hypothetical protein
MSLHGGSSRRDLLLTPPAGPSLITAIRSGPYPLPENTEALRQLLDEKGLTCPDRPLRPRMLGALP